MVLTEHSNPEETEEGMVSGSLNDASSADVLKRVSEDGIKTMLRVFNCLAQKGVVLTPWFN